MAKDIPKSIRELVRARDEGWCIRLHPDGRKRSSELHHRRTRGMGGSRDTVTHTAPNLVSLCSPCHVWVTRNAMDARAERLYVSQAENPEYVPVLWRGKWVLLDQEGNTHSCLAPA